MGRAGGFDSRALKDFAKKLEKLANGDIQAFSRKCAAELAGRVFREARLRTPERLGTLKKGWRIAEPREAGNSVIIAINNTVHYASYVEYGHRIVVGGKIGEGGKVIGFTAGHFMLTRAEERVRGISDELLKKRLDEFLRKALNNE